MSMRILQVGRNGQLGWELQRTLASLGEVIVMDYPEIDLAQPKSLRLAVQHVKPAILINAAAYNDVDKAEQEPEKAMAVNADGPAVLAEEAKKLGAAFVHYSTNFVFDGKKLAAYTEDDSPSPLNQYGASKLAGEEKIQAINGSYLIFRTAWLYSLRPGGFVNKVLQWARQQEVIRVVNDQLGNPTWARMLAEATAHIIAQGRAHKLDYLREKTGLYHLTSSDGCSRFDWAKAIIELDPEKDAHRVRDVVPAATNDFPVSAVRPANSILSCTKVETSFNLCLQPWKSSLAQMFEK